MQRSTDMFRAPELADIIAAATRLREVARRTPLLESPILNDALGFRLLVKAEVLQFSGSFKFRGAYNRVAHLTPAEREAGVVAFSSGNHAQGVALAARLCGARATILMPSDAPRIKQENTRKYGAEVMLYDRLSEDREALGRRLASERGATLVPPFEDPAVIAGQGTIGLEIAAACRDIGVTPVAVTVPVSGGGLLAGIATALNAEMPETRVFAVEPEGFDDTVRSLRSGRRESNPPGRHSICDALLVPIPGETTFSINRRLAAGGLVVSDTEVESAMIQAFQNFKLVIEPGGAVALAALLAGKIDTAGQAAVAVASGGNVDAAFFSAILARGAR